MGEQNGIFRINGYLRPNQQLTTNNSRIHHLTNIMPKEKTTRKAAPKSKADGGKKKKGTHLTCIRTLSC